MIDARRRFFIFQPMNLFRATLVSALLAVFAHAATTDPIAYEAAVNLYKERQSAEATQAFTALAVADPANSEVQSYLGRLALQTGGDPAVAVAHLEKAIALKPSESRYHQQLGDAYGLSAQKAGVFSKMGWAKKCVAAYQRAVELDPANVDAHVSLTEYYRQAPSMVGGGMDKAYAQAEKIKQLDPARGLTVLATLYVSDKKFSEAFAIYEEQLKTTPDLYSALYQIGRLAALSGERVERGIATLRQCLTQTPLAGQPGHAPANWRLGQLLEKQNDKAGARACYEAALTIDPKFTQATESLKKL